LGECAGVLGCCCADGGHVNGGVKLGREVRLLD
jgi:hypothetical protein